MMLGSAVPGVSSFNTRTGAVTLLNTDVDPLINTDFGIFLLAGINGGTIIRQTGGSAGKQEVQISNDGTNSIITSPSDSGWLKIKNTGSFTGTVIEFVIGASTTLGSVNQIGAYQCWQLNSNGQFSWSLNANNSTASGDTGLKRIAGGVIGTTDGGAGAGWLQQTAGEAALAASFTEAAGVLTATNLSRTLKAGRPYRIDGILQVSNSTAAEGVQIDFNGGSLTATTFFMSAEPVGSVVAGTQVSTALNGVINYTTITGTDYIKLRGFIKVNAGGTITLRAAENTSATGTMTLGAGSWLAFYDTVLL